MTPNPQVEWISYADVERYERPEALSETDRQAHRVAVAKSIREQRIWVSGEKHQSSEHAYVPLVDRRWVYTWSMRAWGGLMASIWSVETGASYGYLDFYMSAPASPWGTPADNETCDGLSDDNPAFQRALDTLKRAHERTIARARIRLLEGVDSTFATLRNARGTLTTFECPASTTSPHPATTTLPHRDVLVRVAS